MLDTAPAPAVRFRRTLRRLQEAQSAFDRGEYTACVAVMRIATETAVREYARRAIDPSAFHAFVLVEMGLRPRLVKRIGKLRDRQNAVVHGVSDGQEREAKWMLRLFRLLACRWLRSHGIAFEV